MDRHSYSKAQEIALVSQVGSRCPLCGTDLFSRKKGADYKAYELAHIYPLNPTLFEAQVLAAAPRLHQDVNHPDNLIPLCRSCHGRYDKPRTLEEYYLLYEIKATALARFHQQDLHFLYPIEAEILDVINALQNSGDGDAAVTLEYDAKRLEEKIASTTPRPLKLKIKTAVASYYQFVKGQLLQLERDRPTASELMAAQVKAYYLKQKSLGLRQDEVFSNMVFWLRTKAASASLEAVEIVVSYYVQNCEVFE